MDEQQLLQRITINPAIFGGKPIIRGQRIAVEHILGMLAAGATAESILEYYPYLDADRHPGLPRLRAPAGRP